MGECACCTALGSEFISRCPHKLKGWLIPVTPRLGNGEGDPGAGWLASLANQWGTLCKTWCRKTSSAALRLQMFLWVRMLISTAAGLLQKQAAVCDHVGRCRLKLTNMKKKADLVRVGCHWSVCFSESTLTCVEPWRLLWKTERRSLLPRIFMLPSKTYLLDTSKEGIFGGERICHTSTTYWAFRNG